MEYTYLRSMAQELKAKKLKDLFSLGAPCYVFCRGIKPDHDLLCIATEENFPIFTTSVTTSEFMSSSIRWLNIKLAPFIVKHGCM